MSVVDAAMTREIMRDLAKRPIANMDIHVMRGVVYLRGRLEPLRGYYENLDLTEELRVIVKSLRQKRGIRDVCCEVELGCASLEERLKKH